LTFKILKNDLVTVLHRSVVRSAVHANNCNKRVSFKSDVQESLKLLYSKLSFVWKDSHHKHKSRKTNNDVSNITRSKADYTYQHIGSRTRSKIHSMTVNKLSVQNLFFLCMRGATLFQGHGKYQAQDLQLQESLKLLDTKPIFVWKDSHHKHKSRKTNINMSYRTRSLAVYTDQHIGIRTISKMHSVNNLSIKNLLYA
jgi:hypothetical protein